MLELQSELTEKYKGHPLKEELLLGRDYMPQRQKRTHKDLPEVDNLWVREMLVPESPLETHLLLAIALDDQSRISEIYASVRFFYGNGMWGDSEFSRFHHTPEIEGVLLGELEKTIQENYVPKDFTPVGRPLPRKLAEADWEDTSGDGRQWGCTVDGRIWNCHPPSNPEDPSSIVRNNCFLTHFSSDTEWRVNIIVFIETDQDGMVSEFRLDKDEAHEMLMRPADLSTTGDDWFAANRFFIDLEN